MEGEGEMRGKRSPCSDFTIWPLPVGTHTRDLGVIVSSDLSPSVHITDIVSKAHQRAGLILRTRGLRVYPYPRVYPTRPVPAGTGRVG